MKTLSRSVYIEKMRGCWLGKAIGGTLGFTFEAQRGAFDLDDYPTDVSNGMIPNDDLDLQLVWLCAAERYKTELNAEKLGEYWLGGITPNWAEYGVAKSNLRMGMNAPAAGRYNNRFKDSNGAWIRSEIWACLAPGHPEVAVKYAMEDALVDHADEGVYAEIFMAAMEAAAFVESDRDKLVEIALGYIPADCDCTKAVKEIIRLYETGIDWKECRVKLLNAFPDSFGGQLEYEDPAVPNGNWGYDAPANLALTLIGWLYAPNDFGKAICITAGCGEDGDCTTSALGALMGIILGEKNIPAKWADPIGEEIKTMCVNTFTGCKVPATLTELTRRTAALMPSFIGKFVNLAESEDKLIEAYEGDALLCAPLKNMDSANGWEKHFFRDEIISDYTFRGESPLLSVAIRLKDVEIAPEKQLPIDLTLRNIFGFHGSIPLQAKIEWILPDGLRVEGGNEYAVFVNQRHCGSGYNKHSITLICDAVPSAVTNIVCRITADGYPSEIFIPITLVATR